jgi:hypothetical protein
VLRTENACALPRQASSRRTTRPRWPAFETGSTICRYGRPRERSSATTASTSPICRATAQRFQPPQPERTLRPYRHFGAMPHVDMPARSGTPHGSAGAPVPSIWRLTIGSARAAEAPICVPPACRGTSVLGSRSVRVADAPGGCRSMLLPSSRANVRARWEQLAAHVTGGARRANGLAIRGPRLVQGIRATAR